MSEAPVQSRKICFVELETEGRLFFEESLAGYDIVFAPRLEDVPEDTEILSVFIGERIEAGFLDRVPALKVIATRSTGCDHIDLVATKARGIIVSNVGNYGENTVAEHTFALILALSRRLAESEQAIRTGRFSREKLRGFDLRGRTLGIVGTGRVGLHVCRMAAGFGMRVIGYDSSPHPYLAELLDFTYVSLEELLREAHVISLHVPLNDATRHMINREALASCRDGVLIINTARGGLIDTTAVIEALDSGKVAGLGLDVLEDERVFKGGAAAILGQKIAERVHASSLHPPNREFSESRVAEFSRLVSNSQLLHRPDVILTPHVAFNSDEAVQCLRAITLENIFNYLRAQPLQHICL